MKKHIFTAAFFLILSITHAQEFLGYSNSNYAGITGAWLQPASIVDSRLKADVHLAGAAFNLNNNFLLYDASILSLNDRLFDDPFFYDKRINERYLNNKPFALNLNADVQLFSFMFNYNQQNAFGFSHRIRGAFQIDGINKDLRDLALSEFDFNSYIESEFTNRQLSIQTHAWKEYNIHYARILKEDNEHFLKAGATAKLLKGFGSVYVYSEALNYSFPTNDTVSIINSDISYAASENMEQLIDNPSLKDLKAESSSLGFDLGLVYEYRPNYASYKYNMNDHKNLWRVDENKYKFKAGISLLDVGRLKYNKMQGSREWNANVDFLDLLQFNHISSVEELTDTLTYQFSDETTGDAYKMQLPTALSMQFDYHIIHGVYLNFTPFWGFQRRNNENKTHAVTNYSLTPRWEHEWFDVAMPIHIDQYQNFGFGFNVRLGPFIAGVNNFKNLFKSGHTGELELYAAFKIPIQYEIPTDSDGDEVSDEIDLCPETPGSLEHNGCPDSDEDGIVDRLDRCPNTPGLKEYHGCPDTDLDGIVDHNDNCPNEAGPPYTNGCPDNDADSIPNHQDDCPDTYGLAIHKGCPDSDKDGLIDLEDDCPLTPGPIENKGCPILEQAEQKVVNTAFGNLEFETKKAVIKQGSLNSLNQLAQLMQDNPEWILRLSGHTDNTGTEEFNLELSKQRAEAVQNYLMKKGVSVERFKIKFFGESKPISDNDTESGKQENRRVEMKILFE